MSYFNHHIEELDELIEKNLPDEWKEKLMAGEIDLYDIPNKVIDAAIRRGEPEFWASKIEDAQARIDNR